MIWIEFGIWIGIIIWIIDVDMRRMEIPDSALLLWLLVWICMHIDAISIQKVWQTLCIGLVIFFLVRLIEGWHQKTVIGDGDIKLCMVMIFILGIYFAWLAIMIACCLGICMALVLRKRCIPFGPALCLGFCIVYLWQAL